MNICNITLSSFMSTIISKLCMWVRSLSYFIHDAVVPANFLNKPTSTEMSGCCNPLVRLYVQRQDTGLMSANPLGSLGPWECAEAMARKDRGEWLSWKYLVPRYSSFPSRAGALAKAWWLSSAGGNKLLKREFTVEGNKEGG